MKILICSDGHRQAENAIGFISSAVGSCKAEATLLGIIEHPSDQPVLQEALQQQAEILRNKNIHVDLVTCSGAPLAEIQRRAQAQDYDFVVIGAERKRGGPIAMSAKAYQIIKEVAPPVLVVIGQRSDLRRILICSGGKSYIDEAVQLTGKIACKAHLSVTLLHVMARPPLVFTGLIAREENLEKLLQSGSSLGRNLRREKDALESFGLVAEIKLRRGLVVEEILSEISEGDYDLVVAGSTRREGALHTYIMGDITSEIVNRANRPVLIVRSPVEPPPRGPLMRLARLLKRSRG
jgi:nucleotide-binding universal stress UspA family protein